MNLKTIRAAMTEARRFLAAAKEVEVECAELQQSPDGWISGTKRTGAMRRASLDLTRSLATMRRA